MEGFKFNRRFYYFIKKRTDKIKYDVSTLSLCRHNKTDNMTIGIPNETLNLATQVYFESVLFQVQCANLCYSTTFLQINCYL